MLLSYLLVGFSHGAESYYYQIFLIPVVSAATTFELAGVVIAVTAIAGLAYFSLLVPPIRDYDRPVAARSDQPDVCASIFFAIVAFLVYEQARAKRLEMAAYGRNGGEVGGIEQELAGGASFFAAQ